MKPKKLFVTGIDGFVGTMLRQLLTESNNDWPFELVLPSSHYDLTQGETVKNVIEEVKPDAVLHLAGQSSVPVSFDNPELTYQTNFNGTLNLINALKKIGFSGCMVYVSSGEVYGRIDEAEMPVTEAHSLNPRNPYSVSKVAAEFACKQHVISDSMNIVIARPFNHVGPGQSEQFAVSNFARQVMEIKLGLRAPAMKTGTLTNTRDFTDVRDVVRAYLKLLQSGVAGEVYNICSGREYSMADILEKMFEISGVSCHVSTDSTLVRANEQKSMRGSYEKLKKAVNWMPEISIETSLTDALERWKVELENK